MTLIQLAHHQPTIMPAKAEAVSDGPADAHLAGGIRHVIKVASGIGSFVISRRMDHAVPNGQGGDDHSDSTAGSQGMADHALGAVDGQAPGLVAEDLFDS